jgi:D-glycero-alpha-D-manno-heptose-7-phosphate kinase
MLIARAPVRVSFFGGGTDLPAYYERFGGAVLSTAINKHFYVVLSHAEGDIQVSSADYRTFFRHSELTSYDWDDDLRLPKAVLNYFQVYQGLSIFLASEVPPGTGLGSSGAVTVALVKALATSQGRSDDEASVAEIACEVDIDQLEQPVGKQDQYAAAFGGINLFEFKGDSVHVRPVELPLQLTLALERRVLLFFTGTARHSASILSVQQSNISDRNEDTLTALHEIKALAYEAEELLLAGQLDEFGCLLDRAWEAKKRASQASTNPEIDRLYEIARSAGALGGKIAGAGGGGFLMVYAKEGQQQEITSRLEDEGLLSMNFGFESRGATVLLNALASS